MNGNTLVYLKENALPVMRATASVIGQTPVHSCMMNFARSRSTALTGKVRYSCIFLFMNISFTIRLTVIRDNMIMSSTEIINMMDDSIASSANNKKLKNVMMIIGRNNNATNTIIARDITVCVRIFLK